MNGIVYDLDAEKYHAFEAVNQTMLKKFAICPAETQIPDKESAPFNIGKAGHMLILEGEDVFKENIVEADAGTITAAAYTNTKFANPGKVVVLRKETDLCYKLREAVMNHPYASRILEASKKEVSAFATDPKTGLKLKSRVDAVDESDMVITDLKLVAKGNADEMTFFWEVKKRYFMQPGWYCGVHSFASRQNFMRFAYIVAEKEEPFRVEVHLIDEGIVEAGQNKAMGMLPAIAECKKTGVWPNYKNAGASNIVFSDYMLEDLSL